MPVTRPSHVKVGHLVYRIVEGGEDWLRAQLEAGVGDPNTGLIGYTNNGTCVISLCPDLPLLMQKETVVHEIFHAISCATGIINHLDLEHEREEAMILAFSPLWFQVLADNPRLVKWLTEAVPID